MTTSEKKKRRLEMAEKIRQHNKRIQDRLQSTEREKIQNSIKKQKEE